MMDNVMQLSYESVAEALAKDYYKIYYVNTETDRFIEYREFIEHKLRPGEDPYLPQEDFAEASRKYLLEAVHPDDLDEVLEEFSKEVVLKALEDDHVFSIEFRAVAGGDVRYIRLKAMKMMDESDPHIVIGISHIDAQVKRAEEYERTHRERVTFGKIAEALAGDYFLIYYVDVDNEHYIEYSSHEDFRKLELEKEGYDFFESCKENALRHVYEEDRRLFITTFDKENLLKELDKSGSCNIRYRLMLSDVPTYVSMKATMIEDEHGRHVVIGVSNIDSQVRREKETARELGVVRQLINRDQMTGVKNKYAYTEAEKAINEDIALGISKDFSIVVCDVNGLKEINDTYGHNAGDQYIKDGCKLICDIFRHSPVYRIGGDEFVAVLKDSDHEYRGALIAELEKQVKDNIDQEKVSIACGMADFDQEEDGCVAEVFERADAQMYKNKEMLKSL